MLFCLKYFSVVYMESYLGKLLEFKRQIKPTIRFLSFFRQFVRRILQLGVYVSENVIQHDLSFWKTSLKPAVILIEWCSLASLRHLNFLLSFSSPTMERSPMHFSARWVDTRNTELQLVRKLCCVMIQINILIK